MNKVGFFVCFLKSILAVAAETGTSVMQWGFSLVLLFFFFSSVLFCFAAIFIREVGSPVSWLQHEWLLDVFQREELPGV